VGQSAHDSAAKRRQRWQCCQSGHLPAFSSLFFCEQQQRWWLPWLPSAPPTARAASGPEHELNFNFNFNNIVEAVAVPGSDCS